MASSSRFVEVVEHLLAQGVQVRFRAAGRSMLPTVRDGECLIVAGAGAREVGLGDVVLCQTARGPVAHRVVSVFAGTDGGARFVLRGDAALTRDRAVPVSALVGRVVGVEREGRLRRFARTGARRHVEAGARRALVLARAWLALARPAPKVG